MSVIWPKEVHKYCFHICGFGVSANTCAFLLQFLMYSVTRELAAYSELCSHQMDSVGSQSLARTPDVPGICKLIVTVARIPCVGHLLAKMEVFLATVSQTPNMQHGAM